MIGAQDKAKIMLLLWLRIKDKEEEGAEIPLTPSKGHASVTGSCLLKFPPPPDSAKSLTQGP